jgi:hypothetical protein
MNMMMKAIDPRRFMELITRRTALLPGVVIFTQSIDLQVNIRVKVRVDKRIVSALNGPDAFTGRIKNKENIGKTTSEIVAQWNQDHPDNLTAQEEK